MIPIVCHLLIFDTTNELFKDVAKRLHPSGCTVKLLKTN